MTRIPRVSERIAALRAEIANGRYDDLDPRKLDAVAEGILGPPLVRGGQGRTERQVRTEGWAFALVAVTLVALLTMLFILGFGGSR